MRPIPPNPHQPLTHSPYPYQVSPAEVLEKSDEARPQVSHDCQRVGGVNGWPTTPAASPAAGPSLSSQAGCPGLAITRAWTAGEPPHSVYASRDSSTRPFGAALAVHRAAPGLSLVELLERAARSSSARRALEHARGCGACQVGSLCPAGARLARAIGHRRSRRSRAA
jgi:hypothetical protein